MGYLMRLWPKRAAGGAKSTTPTLAKRGDRVCGLSSRVITPLICVSAIWNILLLATTIMVVALPGNGPGNYNFELVWIGADVRAAMVFIWTTFPFIALVVAAVELHRRKTLTARRATFSAAFCTAWYIAAALIWGGCAFYGFIEGVCWKGSWYFYLDRRDPEGARLVLPWLALGTAVAYFIVMIFAIVVLRRKRNSPVEEFYNQSLIAERQKMSFDSSEVATSTIGSQTLPSHPRSTIPSRQLSKLTHSTRPPTYYSTGEESLLTVDEKDEKHGSFGYA